jgi:hypothetical protein
MIAIYAAELTAVVFFVLAFQRFGVPAAAHFAIQSGVDASRRMRDPASSDDEKEQAARAASLVLMRSFGSIAGRSAAALAASVLPLLVFDFTGLARLASVNELMLSWNGLLVALLVAAVMYVLKVRL